VARATLPVARATLPVAGHALRLAEVIGGEEAAPGPMAEVIGWRELRQVRWRCDRLEGAAPGPMAEVIGGRELRQGGAPAIDGRDRSTPTAADAADRSTPTAADAADRSTPTAADAADRSTPTAVDAGPCWPRRAFPCSSTMFVVTEAEAAAIRAAYQQRGEFSAAVELRRLFPGVTDNAEAVECARTIAGWKPFRPMPKVPRLRRV
jgi:hypothetical protein